MKTIFRFLALAMLLTAFSAASVTTSFAQDAAAVKKELYEKHLANYAAKEADKLQLALDAGQATAIVCASREGLPALEDSACAGRFVQQLRAANTSLHVNDAAQMCELLHEKYEDDLTRLFMDAEHGRALHAAGFEDDLQACASLDLYPVLAEYRERAIVARSSTNAGTERGA